MGSFPAKTAIWGADSTPQPNRLARACGGGEPATIAFGIYPEGYVVRQTESSGTGEGPRPFSQAISPYFRPYTRT